MGSAHAGRCPRRCKTQNCPHRRLSGPNPHAGHPRLPARILRGLQLQCLAPIRPQLRQRQPRLPLPARPPTRPVRITPTSTATHPHPARTSRIACPVRHPVSVAKDLIPSTPHNQPNRPQRHILPSLPRAPNSLSMYWPALTPVGLRLLNPPPPLRRPPRLNPPL